MYKNWLSEQCGNEHSYPCWRKSYRIYSGFFSVQMLVLYEPRNKMEQLITSWLLAAPTSWLFQVWIYKHSHQDPEFTNIYICIALLSQHCIEWKADYHLRWRWIFISSHKSHFSLSSRIKTCINKYKLDDLVVKWQKRVFLLYISNSFPINSCFSYSFVRLANRTGNITPWNSISSLKKIESGLHFCSFYSSGCMHYLFCFTVT